MAAIVFAVAFGALAAVAEDQQVLPADTAARAWVQATRAPAHERLVEDVTRLGSGSVLAPLDLLVLACLWPRSRRLASFTGLVAIGGVVVEGLAKAVVARPRPNLAPYGFPSGHALAAVTSFGMIVYALWWLGAHRRWVWTAALVAAGLVAGVGYSRLYLDAHWLSDVVGGVAGGMAYLLLCIALLERGSVPRRGETRGLPTWSC